MCHSSQRRRRRDLEETACGRRLSGRVGQSQHSEAGHLIAVDPNNATHVYASVELGGLLRSLDGGATFANIIDGIHIDEGFVDVHSVVVHPQRSGQLTIATRFGAFRSDDRGDHWRDLKAPLMRPIGSYCRVLRHAPADPDTIYLASANDFDGDQALFITRDNGASWHKGRA